MTMMAFFFVYLTDVGQIEGAFMQGLGYVTIEQMLRSRHTGELLSVGPGNYKAHNLKSYTRKMIKVSIN